MPASPDVQNYHIGKGIVSFTGGGRLDLHRPWQLSVVRVLARGRKEGTLLVTRGYQDKRFHRHHPVAATVKFTLDEITAANLSFFALGDVDTTVPGAITINGLSKTEFTGELKVVGSNDIGQKID